MREYLLLSQALSLQTTAYPNTRVWVPGPHSHLSAAASHGTFLVLSVLLRMGPVPFLTFLLVSSTQLNSGNLLRSHKGPSY